MPRWDDVRPTLVAAYDLFDESDQVGAVEIAAKLGIDDEAGMTRLTRHLYALDDADYIKVHRAGGMEPPDLILPTHPGRQEVRGWPGPRTAIGNAELLVDLLRAQAEAADTPPEEKTRLRAILNAIGSGSLDALSKVTADLIIRGGGQIT
jgi:hypothetical protein